LSPVDVQVRALGPTEPPQELLQLLVVVSLLAAQVCVPNLQMPLAGEVESPWHGWVVPTWHLQ